MSIDIQYSSEFLGEYLTVEIEDLTLSRYVEILIRKTELAQLLEVIENSDDSEHKQYLRESVREVKKVLRELEAWRKTRRSK